MTYSDERAKVGSLIIQVLNWQRSLETYANSHLYIIQEIVNAYSNSLVGKICRRAKVVWLHIEQNHITLTRQLSKRYFKPLMKALTGVVRCQLVELVLWHGSTIRKTETRSPVISFTSICSNKSTASGIHVRPFI